MRLADQAARDRALDVRRSFIVQAPAGSGKTQLLMQRYLALLGVVAKPESILAITFTRKAAAEMRRRVLDALARAAGPEPQAEHERCAWRLARAARERDRRFGWNLTENPHRLQIRTIDSFCASLVRRMPWLSRLGDAPEIATNPEELYRAAARATVRLVASAEYGDRLAGLLLYLDNDTAAMERLLAAMLARRDQWLRHLGVAREELEAALARLVSAELGQLRSLAERFGPPGYAFPGVAPEDLPAWQELAECVLTKNDRQWRRRLDAHAPAFQPDEDLRRALLRVLRLPTPRFDDSQWEVVAAAIAALQLAVANLRLEFRHRRQADFIEVAQAALLALGTPDNPTDLMLALDARIEHILVDEFQDTSLTQFTLLERLTAGWIPGDGRTLFLVGDPMQSIYRFREAEVGLFLKARNEGIGEIRLEPLELTVNFRSDRRLIEWYNRAFPPVLAPQDDIRTGAVRFQPSDTPCGAPASGVVRIHPFIGKAAHRQETERVVEIIRDVQSRDPQTTIAVLVRARTHLPGILHALRSAGFRYRAVEIESLAELPVVQDLCALTRALLHLGDRAAWLALLRGPWCGLTLADLDALFAEDHERTVWETIGDDATTARLDPDVRRRLARFRETMQKCLNHRPLSLRDRVEAAWLALGGPACVTSPADRENAEAYFRLLEGLDEGCDLDFAELAERLDELRALPDPEAPETLQVMTIHKAKGLEFDVVIVPALGRPPRTEPPRLLEWLELPGEDSAADLLLAPVPEKGTDERTLAGFVREIEKIKDEHETGRLLYVAATRARRELHLLGHATVDAKGKVKAASRSLLHKLWPAVQAEFETAARNAPPELAAPAASAPPLNLRRLASGWQLPPPPPSLSLPAEEAATPAVPAIAPRYEWAGQTLRRAGSVVHAMLHRIAREGLARWDETRVRSLRRAYLTALRELGVAEGELERAADIVEHALIATLEDDRGRWILDDSHSEARSELDLTGWAQGALRRLRVDRTFVDPSGVRWVIDYKTSTHEGGGLEEFLDREVERYRAQLDLYAELIAALDGRPVRRGLYFPLLGAWREWGEARQRAAP
ncbi:MAG: UvrD-helicase domain-containing protein [Bryobacterales bacterium]|nr:UvrD-helicase domain-containing protein [Bryobacterales bacterium]